MRAWIADALGDYREVLRLAEDAEPPVPGQGEVLVDVQAAGLNFADTLAIAGRYQVRHTPPFTPGAEVVGLVRESRRDGVEPGTRVLGYSGHGAFAEQCVMGGPMLFAVDDSSLADAPATDLAAMLVTYQTSWIGLVNRAQLQTGETLLVHSGAGGVGTAAIQIGKQLGAFVIATSGSPAKLDVCRDCGADAVINYREESFRDVVLELTDGRGADVIYDPVGGETFNDSTRCINWNGRLLVVGFASGTIPDVAANRIMLKNIAIVGINWPGYGEKEPETMQATHEALMRGYVEGTLRPVIRHVHPLDALPAALDDLRSRDAWGKIVIEI